MSEWKRTCIGFFKAHHSICSAAKAKNGNHGLSLLADNGCFILRCNEFTTHNFGTNSVSGNNTLKQDIQRLSLL